MIAHTLQDVIAALGLTSLTYGDQRHILCVHSRVFAGTSAAAWNFLAPLIDAIVCAAIDDNNLDAYGRLPDWARHHLVKVGLFDPERGIGGGRSLIVTDKARELFAGDIGAAMADRVAS